MDTSTSTRGPQPGPSSVRKITRRRVPGVADPVDVHVGSRVRLRRTLLGLSQEKLGEAVGLTFQQIQKYERGANRIGASRMYDLSHVLDVPVAFFFEEMPDEIKKRDDTPSDSLGVHTLEEADKDPLTRRETLELVRAYYKVGNGAVRKRVFELIKSLAKMNADY
ncbi:MAG: helix-turn-helix transcriptional regulator [Rhodospirillaceae bacterium]|jgi:transcriptional regulator with XRE-family HTH domain|nr:helix-turn-helix transcriptional regulator [Rhodospirillaceae bacterium]MBT5939117.1 helix-turn-helix transcriptional regulator [Rhodospirillaceae bacterium]MBT7954760.1 helix-turn-helix transcriptional regulator [Rhodospirillaceae bacterium]